MSVVWGCIGTAVAAVSFVLGVLAGEIMSPEEAKSWGIGKFTAIALIAMIVFGYNTATTIWP